MYINLIKARLLYMFMLSECVGGGGGGGGGAALLQMTFRRTNNPNSNEEIHKFYL